MWTAVVTVVLSFLFTGLAANRLIQAWQYRNWKAQQRLSDAEKDHRALQDVFDEVATLAGKRQHKMMRLFYVINDNEDVLKQRFGEYDTAVAEWNERFNAISAKLTMHLEWSFTHRLEDGIQKSFVSLGNELERFVKRRKNNERISATEILRVRQRLDLLQRHIFQFNRDMLKFLLGRKQEIYKEKPLTLHTLDSFPTWELFKALFNPRIRRNEIF